MFCSGREVISCVLWTGLWGSCSDMNSLCSLSYDRSIASSRASSAQIEIWCFLFQFSISPRFLGSSSKRLRLLPLLPLTSLLPFICPAVTCFKRQSLSKCDQSSYPSLFLLFVWHFCPFWLHGILHPFSHHRCHRLSPCFSSTTTQYFPGICDLIFEVCTFQHHKKLCSRTNPPLLSPLDYSQICWRRVFLFLLNAVFCHGNPRFNIYLKT